MLFLVLLLVFLIVVLIKRLTKPKIKPQTKFVNVFGKEYVIDLSPEAQKKREEEYEIEKLNSWKQIKEINFLRDDNKVFYKTQWVNNYEKELTGFYGKMIFSENKQYCVVFVSGNNEEKGKIALIDTSNRKLLYKIDVKQPHRCIVSNKGLVICEDWSTSCYVYVLDLKGDMLLKKRHNTSIGDAFELIDNETKFKYNINYSGQIHIINLQEL